MKKIPRSAIFIVALLLLAPQVSHAIEPIPFNNSPLDNYNCELAHPNQGDNDSDGIGDHCDNCPFDYNPEQLDIKANDVGDICDPFIDSEEKDDIDDDGIPNESDNCFETPNEDQSDIDSDGKGDVCDEDTDGDEIANYEDSCPNDVNQDQADLDSDGVGNECDDDIDGDKILNVVDNCKYVANPDQEDANENDIGDKCENTDLDTDEDGIPDIKDNCPNVPNSNQIDVDNDSFGDACDNCDDFKNPMQSDAEAELCYDFDEDGLPAFMDICEGVHDPTNSSIDCLNFAAGIIPTASAKSKKGCSLSTVPAESASTIEFIPILFGLVLILIRRKKAALKRH